MAKKKAAAKPVRKKVVKSRAERLIEAVRGNKYANQSNLKVVWEPTEIQYAWYVLWSGKQWSIRQIAVFAKKSFDTVRKTLHKIQEWEWDHLMEERVAIAKRQTRTLEATFQEATKGWERSQENAVTVKTEDITLTGFGDGGAMVSVPATKTTTTEAGQAGDASFLNAQMTALKGIRDIWGVEAPKESKVEMTADSGLSTFVGATPEETIRAHLMAELEKLNASQASATDGQSQPA